MIEKMFFLATYSNSIRDVFYSWEQFGFFDYIIPFLLLFSIIFAVLMRLKAFKDNKAISAVISLSVSLMAVAQFDRLIPQFFSEIFPRLGVGLAVILVLLILTGLFIDPKEKGLMYTLLGIGVIVGIVVLVQTAGAVGWSSSYWWYDNWPAIAGVVIILVAIAVIVGAGSEKKNGDYKPLGFFKADD
ncbi:hypothetical protein K9L16_00415 [Candidatus Pacearchaeota archaeon]|nr:hypothetical protein [Candidatus Pacearchaeota archaeon]